nr:hypothetical protein HK105_003361 [Polyrhizophydium stewartii]
MTNDICFKFEDGSIMLFITIKGCVIKFRSTAGVEKTYGRKSGESFKIRYGVGTVSIGIPIKRHRAIMEAIMKKHKGFHYNLDNKVISGGYVWLNASIARGKDWIEKSEAEINDQLSHQVFVYAEVPEDQATEKGQYDCFHVGSFLAITKSLTSNIECIAFLNLRLKYKEGKNPAKVAYRLGATIPLGPRLLGPLHISSASDMCRRLRSE